MTDEKRQKKYDEKFDKLDLNKLELLPGEDIARCIDASQDGKYYFPEWLITNKGRGWSLAHQKWLNPIASGSRNYWSFCNGKKNIKVHQLVCHYFMNKSDELAIKHFGVDALEVHHIIPLDIPEKLKSPIDSNADERLAHCMKYNSKSNIVYQLKRGLPNSTHTAVENFANGRPAKGYVLDGEMAEFNQLAVNSGKLYGNSNGCYIEYYEDKDGNLRERLHTVLNIKGSEV